MDSAWLWLYLAAIALIQPLTWELPYAAGVALRSKKKKKKKKKKKRRGYNSIVCKKETTLKTYKNEKAENYNSDEGTRKTPEKTAN